MSRIDPAISKQLEQIPRKPGVYQFLDEKGEILYVGKAVNLHARVRSYFITDLLDRPWVRQMIPLIKTIETIEAENEVEALILESNLIKKHLPKYNIASKDDKRYAWIAVEQRVPFPRVKKVRDLNQRAKYFGPYPDGRAVNHVLKFIRTVYPFRDCNLVMYPNRKPEEVKKSRLCIYYHLNLCPGPCDNLVSKEDYQKNIKNIIESLQGKRIAHIRELEQRMKELAIEQNYEEAARVRDKIRDLSYLSQRIDVQYGDGEEEFREIQRNRFIAGIKEIATKLNLSIPEEKLKKVRIECYDISNLANEITYGSMTVAIGGVIQPSHYRVFKFLEDSKRNDPEMLKKVLLRRIKHLEPESIAKLPKESLSQKPAIILLDGAQSQLTAAREVIPDSIGVFAISKGKHLKRKGAPQVDEYWIPTEQGDSQVGVKKVSLENPFLFQHLRDEAHRFAIKHLRQGKRYLMKKSFLDDIPGIGVKRRKQLVTAFGSVEGVRKASLEELMNVLNNKQAAQIVFEYLATHPQHTS